MKNIENNEEIWKDIEEYEGLYQVSNLGRVKSLYDGRHKIFREKILKPGKTGKDRYQFVTLYKAGEIKPKTVHRLVAKAFVGGYFNGAVVNHIDHRPSNNVYTNLEWTTQKDNSSREKSFMPEINAKLNSKKVLQYSKDGDLVREWQSLMEINRELGFSESHICKCCNGKLKSAYGFSWKYSSEA